MSDTHEALLKRGARALASAGIEGGARDAELLLRWAAGLDGAMLAARRSERAAPGVAARFDEALARRAARIPVSHIRGGRAFWGRWFEVSADVLDPRPDSETLIAAALDEGGAAGRTLRVLDLGVGSGCLLGTILAERPLATGLGIDASRAALAVAERNMEALGVAGRARLQPGDWWEGLAGAFDLILCNPPYIAAAEMEGLAPEVRDHEPEAALTPGGDGLGAYRRIAPGLASFLAPGGRALFEIGPDQAAAAARIFAASGWPAPVLHRDMDGRDRCLEYRHGG